MKRILLSALIGVGIVAGIIQIPGSEATRTPVDYPLVCRGGGTLNPGPAPGEGNIGFEFTHGTKPAREGLAPGSCSWMDRAMYEAEPNRVSKHVAEVVGTSEDMWYEELRSANKYWTFMVSNNGKGQLIATSARPGGVDVSPTRTTGFTPAPAGAKTWEWLTTWSNFKDFSSIDTTPYFPTVPGQITAGFLHHWDGGHGPFPNQERKTVEFVGTVWFDLSEIFDKPPLPKAEYALLTFKAIESDGPRGVCKDELRLPSDDWLKGLTANTLPKTGSLEPAVFFEGCPPSGCSFDVTSIVNNWITGREDRYGFAISGLDDLAAIGTDDGKNPDNNAHCTTRYGDFRLTVTYAYSEPPVIIVPPKPGTPVRKNVALASNGGTANASSNKPPSYAPLVIDGEHRGLNWLSGGGWVGAGPTNDDTLQIIFNGPKTIDQIDVFMVQDDFTSPVEPDLSMTFTKYGLTDFKLQYLTRFGVWSDLLIPGNPVTGNTNVLKRFTFPELRTRGIRVIVTKTPDGYSRLTEVEAWGRDG